MPIPVRRYLFRNEIYHDFLDYFVNLNLDDIPKFEVERGKTRSLLTVWSDREFEFQRCGFPYVVEC